MLGKTEGKRRRGWQRIRGLGSITDSMNMNLSKLWDKLWRREKPGLLQSMGLQRVILVTEQEQQNYMTSVGEQRFDC